MECTFCKKTYSSTSSLLYHQRSTKSCIKIQNELGITQKKVITCSFCKKQLTTKCNLDSHLLICKSKLKEDLKVEASEGINETLKQLKEDLDKTKLDLHLKDNEIKELREKLKTPPKAQKITNNITKNKIEQNIGTNIEQQNITIYQIMSPEHVEDFFKKHYNLDTLLGGQKALARFVNDGFLKDAPVYICGDRSRQKFYVINDGKKTEDTDCDAILGLTAPGIPHVQDVYETALFDLPESVTEDMVQDTYQHIMAIDEQRADFKAEFSKVVASESVPSSKKTDLKSVIAAMRERSKRLGLTEREPIK
jgi:hypothetical protein